MEGCKGGPVVVRGHDTICKEGRDSGKEAGLKGGPNGAGARGGSDSGERRMRWLESAGEKLGAEEGEVGGYREDLGFGVKMV